MAFAYRRYRLTASLLPCLVLLSCGACTDLRLRSYRNDALIRESRYALGEKYVTVEDIRLCYQDFGQGDTILIIPGLGTSIDFWQGVIPELARQFRVVAVDLPGFGKSDKPDASYELHWIDEKILAFMDALHIERANVIGGSMGGHLGLLLALEHPDRVEKLIMMGSTGDWAVPGPLLDVGLRAFWNERIVADYMRSNWPKFFKWMISHPSPMTDQLFRYQMAVRADRSQFTPEGRASARAIRSIFFSSCRDRLAGLQVPLLLLWGTNDKIHTASHALFIHEHVSESQMLLVPDSGHEVMIDQPQTFTSAVISFFKSKSPAESARAGLDTQAHQVHGSF